MASPDPIAAERAHYLSLLGRTADDPAVTLAELRSMTGAGVDVRSAAEAKITEQTVQDIVGAFGHNPKLRKWYGALANRYASPAKVLVIGDSNSEGTGATTYARRWQSLLQAQMRGRFQPPGVVGATIPYVTASPRCNPLPTGLGVTTSGSPGQASFGLGLRALTVAAGQSVTFTFTGDRCKLLASKGSSVGRYNIALDGGAGVVVDGWQSGSVTSGVVLWDSGALTRGSHTVVVTRDAGTTASPGNVYPEGLLTFDGDHDAGVRVLDAARHAATLATFTASTAWQGAVTTVGGFGLCIMPWGANDSTSGTTAAAFASGLSTLIGQVRSAGFSGSFLLVEMPKRGNAAEQVWTDYRAQLEAIAAADADIAVFDLRRRMPDYGTTEATQQGLYYDEVHYRDKGQGWIADQIATAIIPR